MDKNVLIQYCDMKEEIKDLRRRTTETERQIWKIAEEGTERYGERWHGRNTAFCGGRYASTRT